MTRKNGKCPGSSITQDITIVMTILSMSHPSETSYVTKSTMSCVMDFPFFLVMYCISERLTAVEIRSFHVLLKGFVRFPCIFLYCHLSLLQWNRTPRLWIMHPSCGKQQQECAKYHIRLEMPQKFTPGLFLNEIRPHQEGPFLAFNDS